VDTPDPTAECLNPASDAPNPSRLNSVRPTVNCAHPKSMHETASSTIGPATAIVEATRTSDEPLRQRRGSRKEGGSGSVSRLPLESPDQGGGDAGTGLTSIWSELHVDRVHAELCSYQARSTAARVCEALPTPRGQHHRPRVWELHARRLRAELHHSPLMCKHL
jgi:hypothetical protein